jgi:hypothetical protein
MQSVVSAAGDLFVADYGGIRKVSRDGLVGTVGALAQLDPHGIAAISYMGIALGDADALLVGDSDGAIRSLDPLGKETIFAGREPGYTDGFRLDARFGLQWLYGGPMPRHLARHAESGSLYVCDAEKIRRIDAQGIVSTLAELSAQGAPEASRIGFTGGICVDRHGTVYVSDVINHTVWKLMADRDFDGIPDLEESGSAVFDPSLDDRNRDSDGDGMSNAAEYVAGTDPGDPRSVLRLRASVAASGEVRIEWPGVAGRRYRLQSTGNLRDWTDVGGESAGAGGVLSVAESTVSARAYRVLVRVD